MKRPSLRTFLVISSTLLPTAAAFAQEGEIVTPGVRGTAEISLRDQTKFSAYLEANRSYSCALFDSASVDANNIAIKTSVSGPSSSSVSAKKRGNVTPIVSGGDPSNLSAARVTLTPTTNGFHVFEIDSDITTDSEMGTVVCSETTLYATFNTLTHPVAVLEITNTSNKDIDGKITVTDNEGDTLINKQSFGVSAGEREDIELDDSNINNAIGLIRVTHDGPVGSLIVTLSQYTTNGELKSSSPLTRRESEVR